MSEPEVGERIKTDIKRFGVADSAIAELKRQQAERKESLKRGAAWLEMHADCPHCGDEVLVPGWATGFRSIETECPTCGKPFIAALEE